MALEQFRIYDTWEVTTQGDEEGHTTRHLGAYTGYVDEIAFHLADKQFISLFFKRVQPVSYNQNGHTVSISFDKGSINSVKSEEGFNTIVDAFKGRPASVEKSNRYETITLISSHKESIQKQQILAKLTEEERAILGV